jgi:hypothetical protein
MVMASPLGTAFSRVDALKRQLYDMLTNPRDAAAMLGGRIVESGQQAQALQEQTFGDPNRPFRVTDPQAMAKLTDMLMAGPIGFAPAGTVSRLPTKTLLDQPAENILDTVNPTGGVFVDYNPSFRANAPIGQNLTTYDITANIKPDEFVTVYRGVPKGTKSINDGDFVTTNEQLAKDYAGDGVVISKKVKAKELLDDINEPLLEEYIYRSAKQKKK